MTNPNDDPMAQLERDVQPPPALRSRVEAALVARGALRRSRLPVTIMAAAAAMLLFVAGWQLGARAPGADESGPRFVLLLYEPASFQHGPHDERAAEYGAWARGLGSAFASGDALGEQARVVGEDVSTLRPDGPTGFFVIRAPDHDAAVAVAQTCPHVRYGGIVVVRPIRT